MEEKLGVQFIGMFYILRVPFVKKIGNVVDVKTLPRFMDFISILRNYGVGVYDLHPQFIPFVRVLSEVTNNQFARKMS